MTPLEDREFYVREFLEKCANVILDARDPSLWDGKVRRDFNLEVGDATRVNDRGVEERKFSENAVAIDVVLHIDPVERREGGELEANSKKTGSHPPLASGVLVERWLVNHEPKDLVPSKFRQLRNSVRKGMEAHASSPPASGHPASNSIPKEGESARVHCQVIVMIRVLYSILRTLPLHKFLHGSKASRFLSSWRVECLVHSNVRSLSKLDATGMEILHLKPVEMDTGLLCIQAVYCKNSTLAAKFDSIPPIQWSINSNYITRPFFQSLPRGSLLISEKDQFSSLSPAIRDELIFSTQRKGMTKPISLLEKTTAVTRLHQKVLTAPSSSATPSTRSNDNWRHLEIVLDDDDDDGNRTSSPFADATNIGIDEGKETITKVEDEVHPLFAATEDTSAPCLKTGRPVLTCNTFMDVSSIKEDSNSDIFSFLELFRSPSPLHTTTIHNNHDFSSPSALSSLHQHCTMGPRHSFREATPPLYVHDAKNNKTNRSTERDSNNQTSSNTPFSPPLTPSFSLIEFQEHFEFLRNLSMEER